MVNYELASSDQNIFDPVKAYVERQSAKLHSLHGCAKKMVGGETEFFNLIVNIFLTPLRGG